MEIQVLRNFLAIAREGNITNTAKHFHIAQPSLSRQMKNLEKEPGQQLFVRGSHSVSLTPEGMLLRKWTEDVMEKYQYFSAAADLFLERLYNTGGKSEE